MHRNILKKEQIELLPDLLTLAAMKAFALGGRGKWKDYVDLYFIFKYHYTFDQVTDKAIRLFGDAFNEKLFKQQLAFFGIFAVQLHMIW